MEVGLGIAAGLGWGIASGLAVALMVALSQRVRPTRPPADARAGEVHDFNAFGERRA